MPIGVHGQHAYESIARPALGAQWLLDLFDCDAAVLDDAPTLEALVAETAKQARLTLLQVATHRYEPQGITVIGLVAESHISIHTWPEHKFVSVDLFTCGSDAGYHEVCDALTRHFKAGHHSLMVLKRGDLRSRKISPSWMPPS